MTINNREFTFADGSSLLINRSGIIVLISSNEKIPPIYIPMVIDAALGVGTADLFAGNDYYNPSYQRDLKVIRTNVFWTNNIAAFINHIQNHGT